MQEFLAWLSRILDSWKFWIVIAPWEIGVRIRLGKNAVSLKPGLHWRIPFLDAITLVNTRLRLDATPPVTIPSDKKNHTRYISGMVGYFVSDPLKAMLHFGRPDSAIVCKAQSEIAKMGDEAAVLNELRTYFGPESGITIDFVKFVENVEVRTYRLINGGSWVQAGHESVGANGLANARY